jgi:hypothetical protein
VNICFYDGYQPYFPETGTGIGFSGPCFFSVFPTLEICLFNVDMENFPIVNEREI